MLPETLLEDMTNAAPDGGQVNNNDHKNVYIVGEITEWFPISCG